MSHSVDKCSSNHICRACGRKHHSLLHKPDVYRKTGGQSQTATNTSTLVPAAALSVASITTTAPSVISTTATTTPSGFIVPPSSVSTFLYQQQWSNTLSISFEYMPATALATVSILGRKCKARVFMNSG